MFRRCLSALLILGFAASRLAAVPHAHGTGTDEEHDATPHLHLAWLGHHHHHEHAHGSHHHSAAGHRHNRTKSTADSSGAPCQAGQSSLGLAGHGHDDDAIYLPSTTCIAPSPSQTDLGASPWQMTVEVWASTHVLGLSESPTQAPPQPIPDIVLDGSETYLTLRNLRI